MKRKIIVNNKEFTMPKMSIDTYTECMKENIVTLLDYLKFELDTINENQ